MLTFFQHRLVLPAVVLAVGGLMICCGCGESQQTATSTPGSATSRGGPPPPPPTAPAAPGQFNGPAATNLPPGGTVPPPSGHRMNMPPGVPPSPYAGAAPNANPAAGPTGPGAARDVPPRPDRVPTGPPVAGFEIGNIAPEIEGEDLDGESFRLSDYRGKVVVVDFWGDW